MTKYVKENEKSLSKSYYWVLFTLNVITLLLGVMYLFIGNSNVIWNIYGIIMLATFLSNIKLAAIEEKKKGLGYLYLVLSSLGMLGLPLVNTIVSLNPTNQKSRSIISVAIIFSLYLVGGMIAVTNLLHKQRKEASFIEVQEERGKRKKGKFSRNMILILLCIGLFSGLFIVFNLLRENRNGYSEVMVSSYALFYAITFLSIGVFVRKLIGAKRNFIFSSIILTVTILIFMVCMLPLVSTPKLLITAEQTYTAAFGDLANSSTNQQKELFRQFPFLLPEYFYGITSKGYKLQENVLFYEGTEGEDQGIKLYYDVYSPATDGSELPGGNSVLIRIHGGGWTIGDKGASNFAQMNKYFASQGYIVFDIEYGLFNQKKLIDFLPVAATRVGDFTIDDMVRHVGIFTHYLADHSEEYNTNLDSVFISGGSAGGQLTLASGLAMASGKYTDILDARIKIKGLIPFYPANGLSRYVGIDGRDEFVDPMYLVDDNSPPCLIYQGSHDGVVDSVIADRFKNEYLKKGNEKCAIITMPFGGHGSDIYFSGYYNQVFLYYMERFMYQYR